MVNKTRLFKVLKIVAITELLILLSYMYSKTFFINIQVASLSSFMIMIGSFYAYKKMVNSKVKTKSFESDRDPLDNIDDPHELYEDTKLEKENEQILNFKEIIKQEKKKIKLFNLKSVKDGSSASFSMFRLGGYIFLVLGFIALKNNDILDIGVYLPSLLIGIIIGYISAKEIYS